MPQIQFSYLICSYLPGIPLALVLWNTWLKDPFVSMLSYKDNYAGIGFLLIVPLFVGLFVDGFRHSIEKISEKFGFELWPMISKEELKILKAKDKDGEYNETASTFILNKLATQYFMYEFFSNLCISSFIALFFYGYVCDKLRCLVILLLVFLVVFSLAFACVFRFLRQEIVKKYLK